MPQPAPASQVSRSSKQFQTIWKDLQKTMGKGRKGNAFELDDMSQAVYAAQNGQPMQVQDAQSSEGMEDAKGISGDVQELAQNIVDTLSAYGLLDLNTEGTEITDENMQLLIDAYEAAMQTMANAETGEQAGVQQSADSALPLPAQEAVQALAAQYAQEQAPVQAGDDTGAVLEIPEGADKLLQAMHAALQRAGRPAQGEQAGDDGAQSQQQADPSVGMPAITHTQGGSVESLALEAEAQPVTAAELADNLTTIIDKISANVVKGQQEFEVQLKPEFLGKLSIKLIMDSDGLRAMIKAADMTAKSMIQAQLPGLEEALKEQGIDVREIEVAYEAAAFDFNHQQPGDNRNPYSTSAQSVKFAHGLEPLTYDAILEQVNGLDYLNENSSVEFQA